MRSLLPAAQLPIVFVSANLFDNQPERLAALDCQGFVAKPVLESELLDTLESALALDWTRDDQDSVPALGPLGAESDMPGATLSPELREDLLRLARQGQAVALRQRLWTARNEEPGLAATLSLLQSHAERFDFQSFVDHLRNTQEPSDEPFAD